MDSRTTAHDQSSSSQGSSTTHMHQPECMAYNVGLAIHLYIQLSGLYANALQALASTIILRSPKYVYYKYILHNACNSLKSPAERLSHSFSEKRRSLKEPGNVIDFVGHFSGALRNISTQQILLHISLHATVQCKMYAEGAKLKLIITA